MTSSAGVLRGVGRLAVLEVKLYLALLRWCLRRKDVPASAEAWPYAALAAPVLWLWIFGSATEVVVFHLVIPWETVRIIVDIVSIWGLIWMLGTLAAYRIRPHLLFPDELRIRNSVYHDISVPTSVIASSAVREVDLASSMRALQIAHDNACHVSVGVSGRTNVVLTLRPATPLRTAKGTVETDTVRLWVDDPRSFVAGLNRQLTQARRPRASDQRRHALPRIGQPKALDLTGPGLPCLDVEGAARTACSSIIATCSQQGRSADLVRRAVEFCTAPATASPGPRDDGYPEDCPRRC